MRLLRAAETDVDPLAIHVQRHAGQRGHGVHDQQRPEFVGHLAEWIDLCHHAGRSFAMREADKLDFAALSARRTSCGSTARPNGAETR